MLERNESLNSTIPGLPVQLPKEDVPRPMADAAPLDLQHLKHLVAGCIGEALGRVEQHLKAALVSRHVVVSQLAEQASALGGKRLRPMLVLLSAQATNRQASPRGASDQDDLIQLAIAVELVHAASLIHDDIMDGAVHRMPSADNPVVCPAPRRPSCWATICSPGLCRRGSLPFGGGGVALRRRPRALCEGELRQQLSAGNWSLTRSEYYSILMQKTASLCAVSCRLGARQAGGTRTEQQALQRFGKYLGLAFQVFDDWLDYWGSAQVGKTLGTDLGLNKPTLPLLLYLQGVTDEERRQLMRVLASDDPAQRQQVRQLVCQSGANQATLKQANHLALRAVDALRMLPDSPARSALEALALFSVQRSA